MILQARPGFWDIFRSAQRAWAIKEILVLRCLFFCFFFFITLILEIYCPKVLHWRGWNWVEEAHQCLETSRFVFPGLLFQRYDIKFCPLLYIYPEATEKLMINVDRSFSIKHFLHLMRKFCWLGKYWIVSLYLLILFDTKISSNFEKLVPTLGNF